MAPAPPGMLAEIVELNDYPELARQKGLTRENRIQIEERHGVKIQTKGQYIATGQPIPPGARRLFIEISGLTRAAIAKGRKDVYDAVEEVAKRTLNIPEERLKRKRKRISKIK